MKTTIALLLFFSLSFSSNAQTVKEWGIGAEAMYNVPIRGLGLGIRSHIHFSDRWFISPQFSLYPGWNQIVEFYGGANLNFNFTPASKWGVYATAGPHYNHWMNYSSSAYSEAQLMNFTGEFGGGIVKNYGCWRPFVEYRVNSKWWESNLRLGIVVYFGGCSGGNKRNSTLCPAYTML